MNAWEKIRKGLINKKNRVVFAIRKDETIKKLYSLAKSLYIDGHWPSM